jgi:L-threonylcarbamoyladenylate synthase
MLEELLGQVEMDRTTMQNDTGEAPKAPGMKYRHYAPKAELLIVEGEQETVIRYINENVKMRRKQGERIGVIATGETCAVYEADVVKNIGSREDRETIAKNLFRVLREFDDAGVDVIYSESFDTDGLGQAIMNRLLKAAGHRLVQV